MAFDSSSSTIRSPRDRATSRGARHHEVNRSNGELSLSALSVPRGQLSSSSTHARKHIKRDPVPRAVAEGLDDLRPHLARAALLSGRLGLDRAKTAVATLEMIGLPAAAVTGLGHSCFAVQAIEHQRKRKYPTRRGTILLPARRLAKLRSRQIKSGNRYRHSQRCRSSQKPASSQSFTDLGIP
jgi:hypothetical protein